MRKTISLLLFIFLLICLTACAVPTDGFDFSFSTANVTNPIMATDIKDGAPVDSVTEYPQDTPVFYAVGILNNAPEDTKIRFVWTYLTEAQTIDEVVIDSEGNSEVYISSTLMSDNLWPVGDYGVDMYIDNREEPDATVEFSVY